MSTGERVEEIYTHDGYVIFKHFPPKVGIDPSEAIDFAEKHPWAQEILYHVYAPDGQFIFGNRVSLEEAKTDLEEYVATGGYKKWEDVRALIGSETHTPGMDIDPPIRRLVENLNDAGFVTIGSCAGHGGEEGFVNFDRSDFSENEIGDIEEIFNEHGVRRVRKRVRSGVTELSFPEIRGLRSC